MLCKKEECCGCGACMSICPKGCIVMDKDQEGFSYPIITMTECINCKLCESVCPVLHSCNLNKLSVTYAAKNLDSNIRYHSTSGGVFPQLASWMQKESGYICGAIYNSEYEVEHILSNKQTDIEKMCGAKYAQSDSWKRFQEIQRYLKSGKYVLFVGTPCQVAGLKSFLRKDYENLYTVDMICHGVPSPKIWKSYVNLRQNIDEPTGTISNIELRNKDTGWSRYNYSVKFKYENGTEYQVCQKDDKFMNGFTSNLYLRPSCEHCHFKGLTRSSDITLGDYWGIWDQYPDFDDNQGISVVIIHSHKGEEIWKNIQNQFDYIRVDPEKAIEQNPSAIKSSSAHPKRAKFFEGYNKNQELIQLIENCLFDVDSKITLIQRIKSKLKNWR